MKGVPYRTRWYQTVGFGWLEGFTVSSAKPGDIIEHEGKQYRVIESSFNGGSANWPATHKFIAEKVEE